MELPAPCILALKSLLRAKALPRSICNRPKNVGSSSTSRSCSCAGRSTKVSTMLSATCCGRSGMAAASSPSLGCISSRACQTAIASSRVRGRSSVGSACRSCGGVCGAGTSVSAGGFLSHLFVGIGLGFGGALGGDRLGSRGSPRCCSGGLLFRFHGGVSLRTSAVFLWAGSSFHSLVGLLFRSGTSPGVLSMRQVSSIASVFVIVMDRLGVLDLGLEEVVLSVSLASAPWSGAWRLCFSRSQKV